LANAWQAAMICAGNDEDTPSLYQTIWFEVFEGYGIRVVSTNRFVFLNAWCHSMTMARTSNQLPRW
jgi:hypothetical protein